MRTFAVFYAWQTDRLERLNRHLIRFALNLAAKDISADPAMGVDVRIDAETENELGHVPVTDTILKKIAACDAFVPDLTFIAVTDAGKLVPNPNVMLEYGYALRARSHSVMIPAMNPPMAQRRNCHSTWGISGIRCNITYRPRPQTPSGARSEKR
jgi:hypothetical protein